MTRDEYERLLQSDYWKGYSYSLIKERNFTCEDCGKTFYNERNKLQVHHLVYRDTNPWSYKPEELVVLCEDCHKKRHGIETEEKHKRHTSTHAFKDIEAPFEDFDEIPFKDFDEAPFGDFEASFDNSKDFVKESKFRRFSTTQEKTHNSVDHHWMDSDPFPIEPEHKSNYKYVFYILLVLLTVWFGVDKLTKSHKNTIIKQPQQVEQSVVHDKEMERVFQTTPHKDNKEIRERRKSNKVGTTMTDEATTEVPIKEPLLNDVGNSNSSSQSLSQESVSELLDKRINNQVKNQAQREDVSTEGSTSEILDRITHVNVVKQAKQAGVNTEGSTSEILDRITHANVVKQAKRVGVSTEGSTSEILDRITHANVVKQAKRAGVSTEGSTSEILDRITHANVVKQAKRAGVSTESSTSDILDN